MFLAASSFAAIFEILFNDPLVTTYMLVQLVQTLLCLHSGEEHPVCCHLLPLLFPALQFLRESEVSETNVFNFGLLIAALAFEDY